jgi:glycosyltransferase involved in cell wall biosynthesis
MRAAPRLSIGLPVYNGERYLAESLEGLLSQTYGDFELIVSDNASTDGTPEISHQYAGRDSRISYFRQPRNIGASPNHNFVVEQSRGELFKWASADDLYRPDLLQRCVEALDERPEVVLAHTRTVAVDSKGVVTEALDYPLATASPRAPERFRSMLFGNGGDDYYGVMRADVVRLAVPQGSHYRSDRTIMTKIALHGPFYQVPEWLYLRRDHSEQAQRANPTIRAWCINSDPRRESGFRHPAVRLLAEYVWAYVAAIGRAPLSPTERTECVGYLAQWAGGRVARAGDRVLKGRGAAHEATSSGTSENGSSRVPIGPDCGHP